ncbi:MAG: hypothetical protein BMS9Abin26_1935 [Gammaproteobacteria bacterium]|nr:MAG: hypothetical protein BMS9Abin26_1935 [Gammaproteobacteria bacterium]
MLKTLKIWHKVFFSYLILILLFVTGISVTLYKISDAQRVSVTAIEHLQPVALTAEKIVTNVVQANALLSAFILSHRQEDKLAFQATINITDQLFAELDSHNNHKTGIHQNNQILLVKKLFNQYKGYSENIFALSSNPVPDDIGLRYAEQHTHPLESQFIITLKGMIESSLASDKEKSQDFVLSLMQLRHAWSQKINALKLYTVNISQNSLADYRLYTAQARRLLDRTLASGKKQYMEEIRKLKKINDDLDTATPKLIEVYQQGELHADIVMMNTDVKDTILELSTTLKEISFKQVRKVEEKGQQMLAIVSEIRLYSIYIIIVSLLISLLLATGFADKISAPIKQLTEATRRWATGELDIDISNKSSGEIGELTTAFAGMMRNQKIIMQVKDNLARELRTKARDLEFQKQAMDEHAIVSITDNNGKIIYANSKFTEISLYSSEYLIGKTHNALSSGYRPDSFWAQLWQTILDGRVWHGEVRNKRKDGSYYWLDSTIVPFVDELDKPYQFINISTDITDLKQAENELIEANIKLEQRVSERTSELQIKYIELENEKLAMLRTQESLTEAQRIAHLGSWEWNIPEDNIEWSDEIYNILQLEITPEEFTLNDYLAMIHPDDREYVSRSLNAAFYHNEPYDIDYRLVLGNGEIRNVHELGEVTYSASGDPLRMKAILQDITERKRAEKALKEAYRHKSVFLANMSHELRTPMHAVLSFSNLGAKKIETASREKLLRYFQRIELSGSRLLTLVNDLLDLSKLEAGKMEYHIQTHNLYDSMLEIGDEFSALLKEHNISLSHDKPAFSTIAMFDKQRIGQVLRNLLSNAIKFSPPGSDIKISYTIENMVDKNGLPQSTIVYSIEDRGPGIPADELSSIFDVFVQSTNTKSAAGGTGLGLAICRDIISAHKGEIWAQNSSNGGAIFSLMIPSRLEDAA